MKKFKLPSLADYNRFLDSQLDKFGIEFVGWSNGESEFELVNKDNCLDEDSILKDMKRKRYTEDNPKIVYYSFKTLEELLRESSRYVRFRSHSLVFKGVVYAPLEKCEDD